ncbi:MAG: divergent PAP2 family protein [Anaerolineaceae bacterium]|jgi:hypothetical protein
MSFWDLFKSPVTISGFAAMILAQLLKVLIDYFHNKSWNWALMVNPGGMPSSHSALMTGITASIGFYVGWGSPLFALSLSMTTIVVYDATGVRHQVGLQAARINMIVKEIFEQRKLAEKELDSLREIMGHSPGEALAGMFLGLVVAIGVRLLMPPN